MCLHHHNSDLNQIHSSRWRDANAHNLTALTLPWQAACAPCTHAFHCSNLKPLSDLVNIWYRFIKKKKSTTKNLKHCKYLWAMSWPASSSRVVICTLRIDFACVRACVRACVWHRHSCYEEGKCVHNFKTHTHTTASNQTNVNKRGSTSELTFSLRINDMCLL